MNFKKNISFFLIGAVFLGILSACGKTDVSTSESAETVTETVEVLTSTEPEPEPVTEPKVLPEGYHAVTVSEWGYDELIYLNERYLMARDGDKWIIVVSDTGEQDEWPFKYGEDTYVSEFDEVYTNLQGGAFIGVINEEDGTKTSALYDLREGFIRFKLHKSQGSLVDYRDHLIIAETKGSDDNEYYYIISIKEGKYHYTAYKRAKLSFLRSSYGILNLSFNTFYSDIKTCGWRFNSLDVRDYIDDESEEKGKLLEYAVSVNNSYEDKAVQVWANNTNKEGWVRASIFDVGADIYGSPRFLGDTGRAGFYNLLSQEFIETPGDPEAACAYFYTENGSGKCTVSDGRAAITVETEEGPASSDERVLAYRIFDLRTGDWANEDLYSGIKAFGYHKYVLVKNLKNKLGYINDDDMTQTGEWYDDATSFCNGYALVVKEGKAHLIDEDFNTVSEEFEAESVAAAIDYFEFSDLFGKSVFFAKQSDGKFHKVTIE